MQDSFQLGMKLGDVKRLCDVISGSHSRRFHGAFDGPILRHHHHHGLWMILPNAPKQLDPSEFGAAEVSDDNVHRKLLEDFQRFLGCRSHFRVQARLNRHITAK